MNTETKQQLESMSGHMQPVIEYGDWLEIDGPMGTEIIPSNLVGLGIIDDIDEDRRVAIPSELADYCENSEVYSIHNKAGFGARMSAPGYMDCTPWSLHITEQAAAETLIELYGDE